MAAMTSVDGESEQLRPIRTGLRNNKDEAIWLPPLRSAVFAIQPPHSASDRALAATNEARSPFLPAGAASARTQAERRKLLAKGPAHFAKGFLGCRDGAMTERSSHRQRGSPRCPGALGWLYREPENDARRLETWMRTCPAPECDLRQELRRPVSHSPRKELAERSDHLVACLSQVSRYQPENSSILGVARRRQLRLKELEDKEEARHLEQAVAVEERSASGAHAHDAVATENELKLKALKALEAILLGEDGDDEQDEKEEKLEVQAPLGCGLVELAALCKANPFNGSASVASIAAFILRQTTSEEQRAWMAFCWICYHISFDGERFAAMTAENVLLQRNSGAWGFAKLFGAICSEARLTAKVVKGHVRSPNGLPGDDIRADDRNRHWWNAVFLRKSEWILVDCVHGASKQNDSTSLQSRVLQPFFFRPDPEMLFFSHFPIDVHWQCLSAPLSYDTFISQVSLHPATFSENSLRFFPEHRPTGVLELAKTNIGCVQMQGVPGQSFQASLDGDSTSCFVAQNCSRQMKLKITLVGTRRLKNTDRNVRNASYGVYCVCDVPGKKHLSFKTQVAKNSLNPIWEQTFELEGLQPLDELVFRVFDKDLLGSVTIGTGNFFAGSSFSGEVDLDDAGAMDSKLILRAAPSFMRSPNVEKDDGLVTVYFRTPGKVGRHCLEINTCFGIPKRFRRVCLFSVVAPTQPVDFIDWCFPTVCPEVFSTCGLTFDEALPRGRHVLLERNEIEVHLCKLSDVEVAADVDGDRSSAMVFSFADKIAIRAQSPRGEHTLNVLVRGNPELDFSQAISYRLHVPDDCEDMLSMGYPETFPAYQEIKARIETPIMRSLTAGLCKFRLRLPRDSGVRHVWLGAKDRKAHDAISSYDDDVFSGEVLVREPEVTLFCGTAEDSMLPLLRWKVATGSRRPSSRSSNRP